MKVRSERGTAVVEFAIILPLLLLIVFGIIEFGFILYNQSMLTNATREGARSGILATDPRSSTNHIDYIVQLYAKDYLFNFATEAITTNVYISKDNNGTSFSGPLTLNDDEIVMTSIKDYIKVEATYDYNFLILPKFVQGLGVKKTLTARASMRAE